MFIYINNKKNLGTKGVPKYISISQQLNTNHIKL